jgi:methylmalonyl-CoA epimerase
VKGGTVFTKIHHIAVAVKNVEEATKIYTDIFGLQVSSSGARPQLGIRNAMLPIGDGFIELIEPLDPQQGPVAKFLQSRGEGIYLVSLEVEDIDLAIKSLSKKGVRLLGADPESRAKGAMVFIHPNSTKGVLVQLFQRRNL